MHVLIVDDQRSARRNLLSILKTFDGVTTTEAASLEEARRALAHTAIDLCLIDVCLSDDARNRDGLTLVREVLETTSAVPVCVTAAGDMESIRTAMRHGAYDYLLKGDLCEEILDPLVRGLQERRRLEREVIALRARVAPDAAPPGLIGTSPSMERLRNTLKRVALSDRPVLVLGPSGSGKEVVARAIHLLGPHPDEPLLDLNCGAIPENLIESHLFGHEKGAFTGADRDPAGRLRDGVGRRNALPRRDRRALCRPRSSRSSSACSRQTASGRSERPPNAFSRGASSLRLTRTSKTACARRRFARTCCIGSTSSR